MKTSVWIFRILAIVWAIMIFAFSARDGVESAGDSYWVGMKTGEIVISDFQDWSEEEQVDFARKVDHPIRKMAHATEYAIFAMLLFGACYDGARSLLRNSLVAWLIASLYAGTDEFHQLFVPGRSGQLSDVCLDSVGAAAGLLVLSLILMGITRTKNRKKADKI